MNIILVHAGQCMNLTNSESKKPHPIYMDFKSGQNQPTVIEIGKTVTSNMVVIRSEFYGLLVTFYFSIFWWLHGW